MYRGYTLNIDTNLPSLMPKVSHNEQFQLNEKINGELRNIISNMQQAYAQDFYTAYERSKKSHGSGYVQIRRIC